MARNLAELQAALQNDILTGSNATIGRLSVPKTARPEDRLQVYKNAYVLRLEEILGKDFDAVWTYVGDDLFHDLAVGYIRECPSNNPNARWFSHRFPEFLATHPIATQHPELPEIAQIERAVEDAFDAPDTAYLTLDDLAHLPPDAVAEATFTLHPSVHLMQMKTNAYAIFCALRTKGDAPKAQALDDPHWALVWRWELSSHHMPLDPEEGALLDLLRQGNSFAQLCEIAAVMNDPENATLRMAGYLQRWVTSGFLARE